MKLSSLNVRVILSLAVMIVLSGMVAIPLMAQEAEASAQATAEATESPVFARELITELPSAIKLTGIQATYQDVNRCSAAALTIQLSYFFEGRFNYSDVIRGLNPHSEDVAVRIEEMAAYAQAQGLGAVVRFGGTVDLLKALVANGFPVLVENVYYDGITGNPFRDFLSHNRVIMGYDDDLGVLYTFDSLLGNGEDGTGRPMEYADYDDRWRPFNRDYLVVYRPEEESLVQAILGDHWDYTYNTEYSLQLSQDEIDADDIDSFTLFNMGTSLTMLGRYEEAADYFDQARDLGLPWRMLWYQYGVFEAYYRVGRYQDVIDLARTVIATTEGVEEMYYYIGLAAEGLGDLQRAEANLAAALFRNTYFAEATQALIRVRELMNPQ